MLIFSPKIIVINICYCVDILLGPIMKIYVGVQPWIVLGDPYLAHEILAVNGSVTSNRPYLTFFT